jgi:hypothetical protein
MKQAAISGPLSSTMATRSLRPMPSWFSRATVLLISARKPPCVSGRRPGAESATACALPRASSWVRVFDMVQRGRPVSGTHPYIQVD